MIESEKIVQALCYILQKVKKADKLKLIKLLFLADKRHALRYGRTVTGDEYWAMDYGPVGSIAKDLLSMDKEMLSREYPIARKLLKKGREHNFIVGISCPVEDLDLLSDSDREALDFATDKFGSMTSAQLIDHTHKYPEWEQYKPLFENRTTKRQRIETEEILSFVDGDCMAVSDEHLEMSRVFITGTSPK